jgi:two-component system sensor histidine kinase MprB
MIRRLPLRSRLALLTAAAFAVAIAVAAAACWYFTGEQLRRQLDNALRTTAVSQGYVDYLKSQCAGANKTSTSHIGDQPDQPSNITGQLLLGYQKRCITSGGIGIKPTHQDILVATGSSAPILRDGALDDGTPVRVFTARTASGDTFSIARPLSEVRTSLNNLGVILTLVGGGGCLLAQAAGLLIARAALRPVYRFTAAVEHIARTEDLKVRIPIRGQDEIARLGRSFNTMTEALESSREHQQRLIADAGHELRTPLTSLRANIDLLVRSQQTGRPLPAHKREALLTSLQAQTMELTSLIGDLLELSRPAPAADAAVPTPLHAVVERALQRARLRGPGIAFHTDIRPWFVLGDPPALERAVINLLDNAVKFSPPDGLIEVRLTDDGELTVRDHGPGITPEELPHVFERFWRSPSARSMPGSGLGLSIVAHTVQRSGGQVTLRPAYGGGTTAHVRLPGAREAVSGAGRRAHL